MQKDSESMNTTSNKSTEVTPTHIELKSNKSNKNNFKKDYIIMAMLFGVVLMIAAIFYLGVIVPKQEKSKATQYSTGVVFTTIVELENGLKGNMITQACVVDDEEVSPKEAVKLAIEELNIKVIDDAFFVTPCAKDDQFIKLHMKSDDE